jgi:thiamine pyrophosphokinase
MNGTLFIGGERPSRELFRRYREPGAFIVAADSGLETALELGVNPDLIVGDMDSLGNPALLSRFPEDKIVRFPQDKDETDAEIGMRFMQEKDIKNVTIVGGGAGRLAHLLGILMLFQRDYQPYRWVTAREEVSVVEDSRRFEGVRGQTLSFFPLTETVDQMQSTGLKWSLDGLTWAAGQAGISNIAVQDVVTVAVGRGRLLAVRELLTGSGAGSRRKQPG